MKQDIQKYIGELRDTAIDAQLNYEVWWTYEERESRQKYVDTMNHYTTFFWTSIHAHFLAMLVALYRLYETRPDTVNIPHFIKILEENACIPQVAISKVRQIYQEARPLWVKVSILRNEAFAHRSNEYNVSEVFQRAGVTPDELKDLVERTKKLLNEITHVWNRNVDAFNLRAADDTTRLLEDLKQLWETRSNTGVGPTS